MNDTSRKTTKSKGIGLIEILVSIFLLSIIVGPFIGLHIQSSNINKKIREDYEIIYIAKNEMEILMSKNLNEALDMVGISERENYYIKISLIPYKVNNIYEIKIFLEPYNANHNANQEILKIITHDKIYFIEIYDDPIFIDYNDYSLKIATGLEEIIIPFTEKTIDKLVVDLNKRTKETNIDFIVNNIKEIVVLDYYNNHLTINGDSNYKNSKFSIKDYVLLQAKIEVFDNEELIDPIYFLENIIKFEVNK